MPCQVQNLLHMMAMTLYLGTCQKATARQLNQKFLRLPRSFQVTVLWRRSNRNLTILVAVMV